MGAEASGGIRKVDFTFSGNKGPEHTAALLHLRVPHSCMRMSQVHTGDLLYKNQHSKHSTTQGH